MWDSSVRLVTHLPVAEAGRLSACCTLAGVRSPAHWMRHVLFGDALVQGLTPVDAAVRRDLLRLTDAVLVLRAIVARWQPAAGAAMATRDAAVVALADVIERIEATDAPLDRPYDPVPLLPWVPAPDVTGERRKAIGCVASEREQSAIDVAAKRLDLTRSAWIRAALIQGGLPAPVTPHCDQRALDGVQAMIRIVQGMVRTGDDAKTVAEVARMMPTNLKRFTGAVTKAMATAGAA